MTDESFNRNPILTIRVFLSVFILSLLAPLCNGTAVTIGPEFQVNTYTNNSQSLPSVAGLSGGGFVVTWQSFGQDGSNAGVYGQLFESGGNKVGSEFQVNTNTNDYQGSPSAAGLSDGGFIVTWQSFGQDGSGDGVYGQLFDGSGNKVGSEFQVNTCTNNGQRTPFVAGLSGGGFVVTWESNLQDGSYFGIYGQLFDRFGNKVGNEFQVNTFTYNSELRSSVASLSNGGFVVVWESLVFTGEYANIFAQLFAGSGGKVGSEFQVNTYTNDSQKYPSVAGLSSGGFVVTWASMHQDGSVNGIYGQLFDSLGDKVGSEFQVNTYTNDNQMYSSMADLFGGGYVVTWNSSGQDGSNAGVYGQLFDGSGNEVGGEFQVNTYTNNSQALPSVAGLSGGGFVVTWQSLDQDGSNAGVYGQLFEIKEGKAMPWIPLLLLDEDKRNVWTGPAGFGAFSFVVNDTGTIITEITYKFIEFSCGPIIKNGTTTSSGMWLIADSQFTIERTFDLNLEITLNGTFDQTGTYASGTYEATSYGEICSGTWNASPF